MNTRHICGVDEVGRGTLAGPVVASAVILQENHKIEGLNDSKKLSVKNRELLFTMIIESSISVGIGIIDSQIIDKLNIRRATLLAMKNAVLDLKTKPDVVLVDGLDKIDINIPNENIIKGDSKIDCIMAASIIAKVKRDHLMKEYSNKYPEFGFEKNKGYGTKFHMDMIKEYGKTKFHRKTFKLKKLQLTIEYK